jgi:cation diffusion facilitator CzcD-associated flavoprotein CzcO
MVKQRHRAPAVTRPVPVDTTLPRACVIGAGSSGIAAAKALHEAGVPFDCFEQGPVVGGNWVFENPNGQSACYETLEINTSCPRMAFSDFPMPEDYPAYAMHHQVRDYFESYVDHFGFRDTISFGTCVEEVTRSATGTWIVRTAGPAGNVVREYDAVLVANGHHWDARWPEPAYPGEFAGEQLHAHDYRSGDDLRGRHVVVVGMGNSALDIAVEAARVARSATISVRRGQWVMPKYLLGRAADQTAFPGWMPWWVTRARMELGARVTGNLTKLGVPRPDHRPGQSHPVQSVHFRELVEEGRITPRPAIERLERRSVHFADGTSSPADLIVWATGYRVSFPFLDRALVDPQDNDLPLWKRMVHPDLPGLWFIGLAQPVGAVMPIAEAQSQWAAEMLTGRYLLPGADEVRSRTRAEHERNRRRFYESERHTMEVDFDHYLWDLARERKRGARRAERRTPAPSRPWALR